MHVNVSHILAGAIGEGADFELAAAAGDIPDLELADSIGGQVRVTALEDGLMVRGQATTALRLTCHRCLGDYDQPVELTLSGHFVARPAEDDWPIDRRGTIDLGPMIREEALVNVPLMQLCRPDCAGLCADCGRAVDGHQHSATTVRHTPRITPLDAAQGKKG